MNRIATKNLVNLTKNLVNFLVKYSVFNYVSFFSHVNEMAISLCRQLDRLFARKHCAFRRAVQNAITGDGIHGQ